MEHTKHDGLSLAERIHKVYMEASHTPAKAHGRNVWIAEQMRARNVEVSPESVRKWCAGLTNPRGIMLITLADVLKVDINYLESGNVPLGTRTPTSARRKAGGDLTDVPDGRHNEGWRVSRKTAAYIDGRLDLAGVDSRCYEDKVIVSLKGKEYAIAVVKAVQHPVSPSTWSIQMPMESRRESNVPEMVGAIFVIQPEQGPNAPEPMMISLHKTAVGKVAEPGDSAFVSLVNGPDGALAIQFFKDEIEFSTMKPSQGPVAAVRTAIRAEFEYVNGKRAQIPDELSM